jgi:hypothetical protein
MTREVKSSDFSDSEIDAFFDRVERLQWKGVSDPPEWLRTLADNFVATQPRPTPDEFRLHIEHTVTIASGWDDPDDHRIMFHTAVKAFYLTRWIEYLYHRTGDANLDIGLAMRASFTPEFDERGPTI